MNSIDKILHQVEKDKILIAPVAVSKTVLIFFEKTWKSWLASSNLDRKTLFTKMAVQFIFACKFHNGLSDISFCLYEWDRTVCLVTLKGMTLSSLFLHLKEETFPSDSSTSTVIFEALIVLITPFSFFSLKRSRRTTSPTFHLLRCVSWIELSNH